MGISDCYAYLDDLVIRSDNWADYVSVLRCVFDRLAKATLTLNLAKYEFGKATVTYLGKQVGHGQVRPLEAKVAAIAGFPAPTTCLSYAPSSGWQDIIGVSAGTFRLL